MLPDNTAAENCLDVLGIFGGPPMFAGELHVGRPNAVNRRSLFTRIERILDANWLTNDGPYVRRFERQIADRTGVKHCIATCNGTMALALAARGLGLRGEVIVPAATFIATAHALEWQGIQPVFCDIGEATCTLSPDEAEKLVTPQTTGILGVHLWGRCCEVDILSALAHKHNLKLLFDASHALGCSWRGRMVGSFGDAEVFSFHATKVINTMEGGAVVTNDDDLAHRLRLMRNHGFAGMDEVVCLGINGKMNEVEAAMGLTGLESFDAYVAINRRSYELYTGYLADVAGVQLLGFDEKEKGNYHYIVLTVDEEETGLSRDDLVRVLQGENVLVRRYFYPGCHRMAPYRSDSSRVRRPLSRTDRLMETVIVLPAGTAVGEKEVEGISRIVRFAVAHGSNINERLAGGHGCGRGS